MVAVQFDCICILLLNKIIVVRWASFAFRNSAFNTLISFNLVCVLDYDTIDRLFERIAVSCDFLVNKQSIPWFSQCL